MEVCPLLCITLFGKAKYVFARNLELSSPRVLNGLQCKTAGKRSPDIGLYLHTKKRNSDLILSKLLWVRNFCGCLHSNSRVEGTVS